MNRNVLKKGPENKIRIHIYSLILDKLIQLSPLLKYPLYSLYKNKKQLAPLEKKYISLNGRKGEDYWYQRFQKIHPNSKRNQADFKKLRFVLGLARSGTTWIGRMLATSTTPLRYFEEPLHPLNPALSFSNVRSHTDISFYTKLEDSNRLVFAYKLLSLPDYDWISLGLQRSLRRNDKHFNFCLVKEVHSLLATEALLNKFQVPAIIVIRNPLYIVDSLFDAQTLSSIYLVYQNKLVLRDRFFLKKYFPKTKDKIRSTFSKIAGWPDGRRKIVQQRILMVSLMTKMLEQVAKNSKMAYLVRYEEICKYTQKSFPDMAKFLGFNWNEKSIDALSATMNLKGIRDHYSVIRNTKQQINRPFRFLTQEEIKEAEEILKYCNLEYLIATC